MSIDYIDMDGTVIEYIGTIEYKKRKKSEIGEDEFARHMNTLVEQLQRCWEIIRNREARQGE